MGKFNISGDDQWLTLDTRIYLWIGLSCVHMLASSFCAKSYSTRIPFQCVPSHRQLCTPLTQRHYYTQFYYLAIVKGSIIFKKECVTDMRVQITNVLIRFTWVIYIPKHGPSLALRTWIVAVLEVLRRCQWNVCTSILVFILFACLADRGNV
jgi:EXS family